jgi:two-component system, NarL family, nitrate/nitrite response regulator NarL
MADMIDVLVVSPLATVRAGLASLLAAAGGLLVVGEAVSLESGAAANLIAEAGVVLLDAPSPEEIEDAAVALEGVGPGLVVLGPPGASGRLPLAAPSFAWAFLGRDAGPERIVAAVRAVAAGLVAFEPELASAPLGRPAGPLPSADEVDDLTAREREVLTLVAIGLTNKAIAQRLTISDHTVKFHVAAILAKLGAESRTEAVHLAARRGLLTL